VVPALHNHIPCIPFFGNGKLENKEARGRCGGEKAGNPAKSTFFDASSQGSRGALSPVFPFSFPTLVLPSLFPVPVPLFVLVCLSIASFQGTKQTGRKGKAI
jgi:hypothetical protein